MSSLLSSSPFESYFSSSASDSSNLDVDKELDSAASLSSSTSFSVKSASSSTSSSASSSASASSTSGGLSLSPSKSSQSLSRSSQLTASSSCCCCCSSASDSIFGSSCSCFESDSKFNSDELLHTRTVLLTGSDVASKRQELRDYFHRTFSLYEKLFEILKSDDVFYQQPEKLRHPLVFYFGHTAVFFVNKLRLGKYISAKGVNPSFESLCAVGVDEMSWDDLNSAHYDWPTIRDLREYRDQVRCLVDQLITTMNFTLPIDWNSPAWVILMGCEHERIHLETSSVLFRQLPISAVVPHEMFTLCSNRRSNFADVPSNTLISVRASKAILGRSFQSPMYGWDCDYSCEANGKQQDSSAESESDLDPEFLASKYLCSNAEYLAFMRSGGYSDKRWWGEEGWSFVNYRQATHPVFWVPVDRDESGEIVYHYRALHASIPMPWDWPVDVNYIEAKAFCNWKSEQTQTIIRLPTETEWTRLRNYCLPNPEVDDQPYWSKAPGNINLEHYASSCPIDEFGFEHGFYDVIGNVWQHTETPVYAYKGFRHHPLYDDFSIPTFDTRHNCIKGGSWVSTGNEATRDARYAFRRHFYQHAGFRYVQSSVKVQSPAQHTQLCETDPAVCTFIDAHYSNDLHSSFNITNPSKTFASIAVAAMDSSRAIKSNPNASLRSSSSSSSPSIRVLDVGCAAGRTVFELAKSIPHAHVLGVDNTTRYIRIGSRLAEEGCVQFVRKSEGEIESYAEVDLNELELGEVRDRVEFMQADACNLDQKYSDFDLVLATNLLEYLYSPASFLSLISSRIRVGGLLLLASSYKWDVAFTPKDQWLGGFKASGENVNTDDRIQEILTGERKMVQVPLEKSQEEVMSVTRSTDRSFNIMKSKVTVWKRVE